MQRKINLLVNLKNNVFKQFCLANFVKNEKTINMLNNRNITAFFPIQK